jgi:hypothetical protein
MTADNDDAVLAAVVRSPGSHNAGSREDVGDVAGRATSAVALRIRPFLTRIVQWTVALPFAATTGAGHAAEIAKAVVRAFAVAIAVAATITAATTMSDAVTAATALNVMASKRGRQPTASSAQ